MLEDKILLIREENRLIKSTRKDLTKDVLITSPNYYLKSIEINAKPTRSKVSTIKRNEKATSY